MVGTSWFSAKLRFAIVNEFGGLWQYHDSVRLFKAEDWDEAFAKVLQLGRSSEQEYKNCDGERVAWRLASIESLDMLGGEVADGQEVHSQFVVPDPVHSITFETTFQPEVSERKQSL